MKTNPLPRFIQNASEINIIGPCSILTPILNENHPSLLIDGGIEHNLNLTQVFSLGDGDSSTTKLDFLLPVEKDLSDLAFALENLPYTRKDLYLYGMLGERKDHELINIGEVYKYCKNSGSFAKFDKSFIILPQGEHIFSIFEEFSVMTLEPTLITIKGKARYTLDRPTSLRPFSSLGLSNVGNGEITIKADSPLIIYTQGQSLTLP